MFFAQDQLPEEWQLLAKADRQTMATELQRELSKDHELHGRSAVALARRLGADDVLFTIEGSAAPLYVIHLTWAKEWSPLWPTITAFRDRDDFITNWRRIFD